MFSLRGGVAEREEERDLGVEPAESRLLSEDIERDAEVFTTLSTDISVSLFFKNVGSCFELGSAFCRD